MDFHVKSLLDSVGLDDEGYNFSGEPFVVFYFYVILLLHIQNSC